MSTVYSHKGKLRLAKPCFFIKAYKQIAIASGNEQLKYTHAYLLHQAVAQNTF